MTDDPRDPVAAVTHPDPYPYYATLLAQPGAPRHDALGIWVVARAAHVTDALTSGICGVRPPAEPVPPAIVGTAAGDVFARLVRMNDGAGHDAMKRAVSGTLGPLDMSRVAEAAGRCAQRLVDELAPATRPKAVSELGFRLPAEVVASLLGFPDDRLATIAALTGDLVRGIAPGSAPAAIARGATAAANLRDMVRERVGAPGASLLGQLAAEARAAGRDDAAAVANGIGFLSQSWEATAGLIGNTLVAFARQVALRDQLGADPGHLRAVVREVVRHDPPVQNTRRFVLRDGVVGGRELRAGDTVLVVLAAANHDPAANADPWRFDVARADRRVFTFGAGPHACPGEELAVTIAQIGVERMLAAGVDPAALVSRMTYRPSGNTRIPLFGAAG